MRNRLAWWLPLGLGLVSLVLGQAEAQPPQPAVPPRQLPPSVQQAGFVPPQNTQVVAPSDVDLTKLPPLAQEVYRSARGGAEWLCRAHQANGRFVPGVNPSLNRPLEEDHFLRQAAATLALARAARVFKDERYAAHARQAVLTLLAETGADPEDSHSRMTTLPSAVVNRLGAAGLLLASIHELPDPTPDLLNQGDQLARFIARRQLTSGVFRVTDTNEEATNPNGISPHSSLALLGLVRSNGLRPAAWKTDAARRALAACRSTWPKGQVMTLAAGQTAAFAEAFVESKERARDAGFADFVFELVDWLSAQQIRELDPRHPQWQGGFRESAQRQSATGTPNAISAVCAEALIHAARVARHKPDAERFSRYREAATSALQFVMALQYGEANTQHFAPAFRQQILLGGFHTSPDDGTLRLEDTAHAVAALSAYWESIVLPELPAVKKPGG